MTERFIAERGSGRHGTAYNTRDWEVLDTERKAGNRIVCRANGKDAHEIAAALNLLKHLLKISRPGLSIGFNPISLDAP